MKRIFTLIILVVASVAVAQTSSPYSRYGLGSFQEKGSVRSRMMGGTGVANQSRVDVNGINPAALVAMDSTTVLFDIGLHGNMSNFSDGDYSKNVFSGNIDYVTLMIPVLRCWYMSLSVQPLSSVGYNINTFKRYNGDSNNGPKYLVNYKGEGGISMATMAHSIKLPLGFSIGGEVGFLWGNNDETILETYTGMDLLYTRRKTVAYHSGSWLSTGIQYSHTFNKLNMVLGVTYDVPTVLTSYEEQTITSSIIEIDQETGDKVEKVIDKNIDRKETSCLPQGFGAGLSFTYDKKYTVSADYRQKQWEGSGFGVDPQRLCDNNIYSLGFELIPDLNSNQYFDRVAYRLGAHYESGSFKVGNSPVSKGYISAGFGFPSRMSSTVVSFGFEVGTIGGFSKKHLTENYAQINVGLNLGERWFMKPKFY